MKTAWLLWRLVRQMKKNRVAGASASINIIQEKEGSASRREVLEHFAALGMPPPPAREGVEVTLWLDVGQPAKAHRGHTIAEALEKALRAG